MPKLLLERTKVGERRPTTPASNRVMEIHVASRCWRQLNQKPKQKEANKKNEKKKKVQKKASQLNVCRYFSPPRNHQRARNNAFLADQPTKQERNFSLTVSTAGNFCSEWEIIFRKFRKRVRSDEHNGNHQRAKKFLLPDRRVHVCIRVRVCVLCRGC